MFNSYLIRTVFLILLFLPGKVWAQEEMGFGDAALAGTVKNFAKVFVETADLNKIKTKQIKILIRMKDDKFQKRYAEFYMALRDVPPGLLARYGIVEHMSKQEAIAKIRYTDKSRLEEIIEIMPDRVIVKYVKKCLRQQEGEWKSQALFQQINSLWEKSIAKAG